MNTILLAAIALLLALILIVLLPKTARLYIRVTVTWLSGLLIVFTLGLLWLGSLGLAIYMIYRAHGRDEVGGYLVIFGFVLVALGRAFVRFLNRFHEWWLDKRVNAMVDSYQSEVSLEFSETFKRQLRDSPTFHATVLEAKKLLGEMAAFSAVPHANEEWDAFRKVWQARVEKFAERVAEGDPLAVEVILKAIEKESVRSGR